MYQRMYSLVNFVDMNRHAIVYRRKLLLCFLSCLLTASVTGVYGQFTAVEVTRLTPYQRGLDHYDRGEYDLAIPYFREHYLSRYANSAIPYTEEARSCMFYLYDCLLRADKNQVIYNAQEFIRQEDPVIRKNQLSYQLAAYYFRKGDFTNSLEYDERAGAEGLSNEQIGMSSFRKAYALFHFKRFGEAKPLLSSISQVAGHPNQADARYYLGFIAYEENDYATALQAFEEVRMHPDYANKVPYYLTSVYFNTGSSDKAIREGEAALKKAGTESKNEIRRLLGHIYYDRRQYDLALPHLEAYVAAQTKVGRDVYFELQDTYYRLKKYDKAIPGLRQLSAGKDKLSQFAMYLLADAYLQTNQKDKARNAFSYASVNNTDSLQKEVSVFMFGKLSAELGYQGEAMQSLQQFITDYPKSIYQKEAKELMIMLLTTANSYKDAIVLLETIPDPSEKTRKLIPVMKFGRATELLNDQQLQDAEQMLDDIEKLSYKESVWPLVQYWKGELAYKRGDMSAAISFYQSFIKSGHKGQGEATQTSAIYNLGYCYLKTANYQAAWQQFDKAVPSVKASSAIFEQDGFIRKADCYFMLKQYAEARAAYQKAIDYNWRNADYATFQKAMIAGISGSKAKIDILKSMEASYPASPLLGEAVMEIAKTLMSEERFREAIPYLSSVAQSDTSHPYHIEAILQLGVAWYNLDDYDKALVQFNRVLKEAPYSAAAEEAMDNMRSIYLETGELEKYEAQMRSMGMELSASQADSLAYASVEMKLAADDCKSVIQAAGQYLTRFPDGAHHIEALFHQSECYMSVKNKEQALKGYEIICSKGNNPYIEKAALIVSRSYFFDKKDYAKAQPYYELLQQYAISEENKYEALRGHLRCLYYTKDYEKGAVVAREMLPMKMAATDDRALSHLIIGKYEQFNGNAEKAITSFKQTTLLNKAEWAAEAGYEIAAVQYAQLKYEAAEKSAFEVIRRSGSYPFWVTRSYLLLGDIFFAQKDYFNAKATYQSVAENAKDPELKNQAADKLIKVKEEENAASPIQ
jgi:tetratricopeptide (TPR) repeat protein